MNINLELYKLRELDESDRKWLNNGVIDILINKYHLSFREANNIFVNSGLL